MSSTQPAASTRQMKLAVFLAGDSNYHRLGWRHPDSFVDAGSNFERWLYFARTMEAAKMDMLFIADSIAIVGSDDLAAISGSSKVNRFEPITMLSALAPMTKRLGLVATCATAYNEPYTVARMFSSLDHLSGGRAGWNLVTGGQLEEAQNFSLKRHDAHADRYERAEEFADVVTGLWNSFDEDALIRDKVSGKFFDPTKIHQLNHVGKYFSVKGPLSSSRTPQGQPVIIVAGASEATVDLGSRVADVVFTASASFDTAREFYGKLRKRAAEFGRSPDAVKIMPGISAFVGRTRAEAQQKFDALHSMLDMAEAIAGLSRLIGGVDLSSYSPDEPMPALEGNDLRMSGPLSFVRIARERNLTLGQVAMRSQASKNHFLMIGDARDFADEMERWFKNEAADGFNLVPATVPGSLDDFTSLVIPELQRRGLFRTEYEGATLRENLGVGLPVSLPKVAAAE